MVHIDYRDARPIYIQIAEGYRAQIMAEVLLPGERMPSVRELAATLAINPNTIQRAYRELEQEGWIASVGGKGSFVAGVPAQNTAALMEDFDRTAAALLSAGVTRQQLLERLGGIEHA